MNNVTIEAVLASSDEFERLVAEIMINDELIGHVEKEKPNEPCKTVFYDDIPIFPPAIVQKAIEHAQRELLAFFGET